MERFYRENGMKTKLKKIEQLEKQIPRRWAFIRKLVENADKKGSKEVCYREARMRFEAWAGKVR